MSAAAVMRMPMLAFAPMLLDVFCELPIMLLLSNAETRKDGTKHLVGGDFSSDASKME
jgi:hypothetical protein